MTLNIMMTNLFKWATALLLLTTFGLPHAWAAASLPVPDGGWRCWPDTQAAWQKDETYLPADVPLATLPVHPPTGGWQALNGRQGVPVTLPSTVEEHFWGKFGRRPFNGGEYVNADSDPQVKNGNYEGVSWWWRNIAVPAGFAGKTVILHVRGARQRAEVYLNQKLVGYSMIEETGFDCDLTRAVRPGQVNQLAIRITNPGGRLDWGDWMTRTWGGTTFFLSHGFGGLDRGLTLTAHDPIYFADAWALNTPRPRTIQAHAILHNGTGQAVSGIVRASVVDTKTNSVLATRTVPAQASAGHDDNVQIDLNCPRAALWDLKTPRLYRLRLEWHSTGTKTADTRDVTFGFRWFAPEGIGKNAVLRLNGRRVRVYSSISWGFWGLNGLWPTPALAVKEVTQAQRLGLNALNFHRNMGKAEVLDVQDRLGLLRYMEPGGGQFAIGKHDPTESGAPTTSLEKYQEERILRMIRDARSHPSLVLYVIQNEATFDLKNPRVFALLRRMHREDPSRTVVLKSGIETPGEAWMKPYDDTVYYDHGDGYSGWSDHHTVGYPEGIWKDEDYKGPEDYAYRSTNTKEIIDWGEMGGAATPDNHALMVAQLEKMGGQSYDLKDHQEILHAYDAFLDKWGFRAAFPTASQLFTSIGDKEYEYWGQILENARLSEANDYMTVSGWESTAIENHSSLVDNLRNFKGHPSLVRDSLRPLLPVVKPRQSVLRVGESATLDLYLLNETNRPAAGPLRLTLTDPQGRQTPLGTYPLPRFQIDRFVYPVKMAVRTPSLAREGVYRLTLALPGAKQVRELRVVGVRRLPGLRVGVVGQSLLRQVQALSGVRAETYRPNGAYDVAVLGGIGDESGAAYGVPDDTPIAKTDDPALYRIQRFGKADNQRFVLTGLPHGPVQVTLLFAETYFKQPDARKFDVVINGQTVLRDFDIFAESGGLNVALSKTFTVNAPDGTVEIRPGNVAVDNATFAALRATAGGKTVAFYFGDKPYTDKSGQTWQPYQAQTVLDSALLARVRRGLPLLLWAGSDTAADAYARQLAFTGAFRYDGLVGRLRAPWMGCWYFLRDSPLSAGLPTNEALHGDYQVSTNGANGLRVDGPGVQVFAAYGRDHDRNLGAATFTVPLGQGTVLFHAMPPMHPAIQQRWLANALAMLAGKSK